MYVSILGVVTPSSVGQTSPKYGQCRKENRSQLVAIWVKKVRHPFCAVPRTSAKNGFPCG